MTDTTISVRIEGKLRERMRAMEEINWSAVLRRALVYQLNRRENLEEKEDGFDYEDAIESDKIIERLRKKKAFNKGKSSVEIIRKWRDKRKL